MTRTDLEINQQGMWRMLVFEERTTLTLAVEMLLRCQLSPEQTLDQDCDGTGGLTLRFVRLAVVSADALTNVKQILCL
jgi:hypothetical protein